MTSEQLQRIKELYLAASERDTAERAKFLDEACEGDNDLHAAVELLLAQEERAPTFLETSAIEYEARLMADEETHQFKTGEMLGHYRIESLVGRGGMGEVYLAEDPRFGRKVAIKVLRSDWLNDAERVRRFEQEAREASKLNHPNIVTVYDIGEVRGLIFLVTEFVEGQALRQRLKQGGLELPEALSIGIQIAEALGAAHAADIVHRDIKPENVLLRTDSLIKLIDFGIAKRLVDKGEQRASLDKITATGEVVGTAGYISPEQARGHDVDARTDIFSLGVVLYEMVTGRHPFPGETQADVFAAILNKRPMPLRDIVPSVPYRLESVVAKALNKELAERQQSVGEISQALKSIKERLVDRTNDLAQSATEEKETKFNPLLSEWEYMPRVHEWLRRNPQGGWLALTMSLAAMTAILLSRYVGAAGIQVKFASEGCESTPPSLVYGYLVELNAGLLYLIGVPLVVIIGFHLLEFVHVTLQRLVSSNRLIAFSGDAKADPLAAIARLNQRLFRITIPIFVLYAVIQVGAFEYLGLGSVSFGWVQSLHVKNYVGKKLEDLPDKASALPSVKQRMKKSGCVIKVGTVEGGHGDKDRQQWITSFVVFLALALGLQATFIVFALWIAAKVIFLFVLLIRLLIQAPNDNPTQPLRLRLDFEDESRRFGLGALDAIHNAFMTMILLLAIVFLLARLANVPKGTSIFSAQTEWELAGQVSLLVIGLSALALLLVGPVIISVRLLETSVAEHLKKVDRQEESLKEEIAVERDSRARQELRELLLSLQARKELAQQQRAWPRQSLFYRRSLLLSFTLLIVLPIGIEMFGSDRLYRLIDKLNCLLYQLGSG